MRDFYRSQGRLATEVEPKFTPRTDGQVELVFAVKEAEVTKVDNIVFLGNRSFSERRELRDVITTSQSGWFDISKDGRPSTDPERIKQDQDLLRQFVSRAGLSRCSSVDDGCGKERAGYRLFDHVHDRGG